MAAFGGRDIGREMSLSIRDRARVKEGPKRPWRAWLRGYLSIWYGKVRNSVLLSLPASNFKADLRMDEISPCANKDLVTGRRVSACRQSISGRCGSGNSVRG